ncbi:MAG TPA: hypothetical protein VF363_03720 [Candidatus Eisenbacteria bacterium]
MFRFLLRFLLLLLAMRLAVDFWRRAFGPASRSSGPPGPSGSGSADSSRSAGAPGAQGRVQGRAVPRRSARARLDREDAVDVPFVDVGGGQTEPSAPRASGADRG